MLVKLLGSETLVKSEQPLKSLPPMLVRPAGIVMLVIRVFWNVYPPKDVIPLGSVVLARLEQS